jgi:ferritin-like metal-binding protein YciE
MDELFLHILQDPYYAENQILKALPKIIDKATFAGLRAHCAEQRTTSKDRCFIIAQVQHPCLLCRT